MERLAQEWRSEGAEDGDGGVICGRMRWKHMDVVWRKDLQALVVWVGWRGGGSEGRREGKEDTSEWAEKDKQQTGASASQEHARDRVSTKRRINKQDSKDAQWMAIGVHDGDGLGPKEDAQIMSTKVKRENNNEKVIQ